MKLSKGIFCREDSVLQFLSPTVRGACDLHCELLKYKSNYVTRIPIPHASSLTTEGRLSASQGCKVLQGAAGLPCQGPPRLFPGIPSAPPDCDYAEHPKAPVCSKAVCLQHCFPLYEILYSAPHLPHHSPHLLILQDNTSTFSFFKTSLGSPKQILSLFWGASFPL